MYFDGCQAFASLLKRTTKCWSCRIGRPTASQCGLLLSGRFPPSLCPKTSVPDLKHDSNCRMPQIADTWRYNRGTSISVSCVDRILHIFSIAPLESNARRISSCFVSGWLRDKAVSETGELPRSKRKGHLPSRLRKRLRSPVESYRHVCVKPTCIVPNLPWGIVQEGEMQMSCVHRLRYLIQHSVLILVALRDCTCNVLEKKVESWWSHVIDQYLPCGYSCHPSLPSERIDESVWGPTDFDQVDYKSRLSLNPIGQRPLIYAHRWKRYSYYPSKIIPRGQPCFSETDAALILC